MLNRGQSDVGETEIPTEAREACEALDWWPVAIDERVADSLDDYVAALARTEVELDRPALDRADRLLVAAMARQIHDIIDGAAVSHYCHLINGWGDARINGGRLSDGLAFFARPGADGPRLLQYHREGDFHPWQSLAYATMAGADLDRPLAGLGCSLRELYARSLDIPTDEGEELGHLLFALAWSERPQELDLRLDGEVVGLDEIMDRAIAAHHHGHFKVCCKIHLSEGIAAAAARIPELARYRDQAQAFVDGQLDLMLLHALATRERAQAQLDGVALGPDALSAAILAALARTDNFEDHLFFAGHQVELACFALALGYEIPEVHLRAMIELINATNLMLPRYLPRSDFAQHYLFYGHYRRAITMLATVVDLDAAGQRWTAAPEQLAGYCVDFDAAPRELVGDPAAGPDAWAIAPRDETRAAFTRVIEAVEARLPAGVELRGYRSRYRTVRPLDWPRSLHYELLDHVREGPYFSVELHSESEPLAPLNALLAAQLGSFEELFPGQHCNATSPWLDGGCRVRVYLPDSTPPEEIAARVVELITRTQAAVQAGLDELREGQGQLGLVQPRVFDQS